MTRNVPYTTKEIKQQNVRAEIKMKKWGYEMQQLKCNTRIAKKN